MKNQKGISTSFAILTVGIIAIIGFAIFYSYQYIWTPEEEITTYETEKPYIKVIFPNGGEVLELGKTYNITWESRNVELVAISISNKAFDSEFSYNIAEEAPNTGSYSWQVPNNITEIAEGWRLGDEIKIEIYELIKKEPYNKYGVRDESDGPFYIGSKEKLSHSAYYQKSYRNKEYEYEVKFPERWEVRETYQDGERELGIKIKPLKNIKPEEIFIDIIASTKRPEDWSLGEWLNQIPGKDCESEIIINQIKWCRVSHKFEGVRADTYGTTKNGIDYVIQLNVRGGRQKMDYYLSETDLEYEFDVLNLVVSNFSFIELLPELEDKTSFIETTEGYNINMSGQGLNSGLYYYNVDDEKKIIIYGETGLNFHEGKVILKERGTEKVLMDNITPYSPGGPSISVYKTNTDNIIVIRKEFADLGFFFVENSYFDLENKTIIFSATETNDKCSFNQLEIGKKGVETAKIQLKTSPSNLECCDKGEIKDIILNGNNTNVLREPINITCHCYTANCIGGSPYLNIEGIKKDFSKIYLSLSVFYIGRWERFLSEEIFFSYPF